MVKSGVEIKGLKKVTKNLRREVNKIEGDTFKGVKVALAWLQGRIIKVTPVDFGFLRNSIFTFVSKAKNAINATIGFTISYAPFVHEKTDADFKAPGTHAKFLEKPVLENQDKILQIIANEAKIK